MSFRVPNLYRIRDGLLKSDDSAGNNGAFLLPGTPAAGPMLVIASDGEGWEHVSCSLKTRCPTWDEMVRAKLLFWDDPEDWAVQYHPPMSRYVNNHKYCLHLWRPTDCGEMPFPPTDLVGIK